MQLCFNLQNLLLHFADWLEVVLIFEKSHFRTTFYGKGGPVFEIIEI